MPTLRLSALSNFPGRVDSRRRLAYTLRWINGHWGKLRVTIVVEYNFMWEQELWDAPRIAAFKHGFGVRGSAAWTRQYLLLQSNLMGNNRVEVEVVLEERQGPANEHWHVVAMPPEAEGSRTHVDYCFTGRFPPEAHTRESLPRESLLAPERHQVACVVLGESDNVCNHDHVAHLPQSQRTSWLTGQRGVDHEIGHMLGMQHPRAVARGHAAYGDPTDLLSGGRVMGLGSTVTPLDYLWAKRIMLFNTGESDWTLVPNRRGGVSPPCR